MAFPYAVAVSSPLVRVPDKQAMAPPRSRRLDLRPLQKERLFTVREVAVLYHVHIETIRRYVRKGIIGHRLMGPNRLVRIPESEVARYDVFMRGAKP